MDQFFSLSNVSLDYPLPTIVVNILLSFLIGLIIATVYKNTHRSLSYSASFTFTLVLLSVSGSILMMIVGNSLARAFSLFGAFSIIRFRTAVKEARDIAFVFISLILGMAVGTNNYTIAVVSTILIMAVILFLTKKRFGFINQADYLLVLELPASQPADKLLAVFKEKLSSHHLANLLTFDREDRVEMTYNIKLKPKVTPTGLISNLRRLKGVDKIRLVSLEDQAVN